MQLDPIAVHATELGVRVPFFVLYFFFRLDLKSLIDFAAQIARLALVWRTASADKSDT